MMGEVVLAKHLLREGERKCQVLPIIVKSENKNRLDSRKKIKLIPLSLTLKNPPLPLT